VHGSNPYSLSLNIKAVGDIPAICAAKPVLNWSSGKYNTDSLLSYQTAFVTIQAASNLTGTCRTEMVRLSSGDALLLEKCRSND
jgi:hypothetical protein